MGGSSRPRGNEVIEDQVLLNRSEKEFTHSAGFVRLGDVTFKFINLECERTALMSLTFTDL